MSKATINKRLAELEAAAAERPRLTPEQVREIERSVASFCDVLERITGTTVSEEEKRAMEAADKRNYADPAQPSYDQRLLDIYGPDAQKPYSDPHLEDNGN